MRIKFRKGEQRRFIDEVLAKSLAPSLRSLGGRGINANYQSLKSYYNENRMLPESLFLDLCRLAEIKPESLKIMRLDENWGKIKGGKK